MPDFQHPPLDEERYTRLLEAFYSIPYTSENRLRRDLWRRLNALNQQKLRRMDKANKLLEATLAAEETDEIDSELRQELAVARGCNPLDVELPPRIMSQKQHWKGFQDMMKHVAAWWHKNVLPFINRLWRDTGFVVWLYTHLKGGRFGSRLGFLLP
jgi:hypothetical protein